MNVSQFNAPQTFGGPTEAGEPSADWKPWTGTAQTSGGAYQGNALASWNDGFSSQYPAQRGNGAWRPQGTAGPVLAAGAGGQSMLSQIQNIFANIMNALQNMLSQSMSGADSQQTNFTNATVSSTGDPHLAVTGTDSSGNAVNGRYDSMTGHSDLVDSDSFNGGFRISTDVTAANANGITQNQSATIHSNYGQNSISMDASGNASVTSNGQQIALQTGQPTQLDGGQTVTKNQDGSLTVVNDNGFGGTITTTMRANGGGGVDVTATGSNVDMGGDIVNASTKDYVTQQPGKDFVVQQLPKDFVVQQRPDYAHDQPNIISNVLPFVTDPTTQPIIANTLYR